MKEVKKKRLNAKLECHLTGPQALSHEVSERETFCNNFYSTIFLQKKKNYSFLELNNYSGSFKKIIIIVFICVQFITIFSLHIYSLLKVRLIFHPKKKRKEGKIKILF